MSHEKLLKQYNCIPYAGYDKYPRVGHTYRFCMEQCEGIYWAYETEDYIINIQDICIKQDMIIDKTSELAPCIKFMSVYMIRVDGELLDRRQTLSNNMLFITSTQHPIRSLLRAGHSFCTIGIHYKKSLLQKRLIGSMAADLEKLESLFVSNGELLVSSIEKIANDILHCRMNDTSARLFLDAKATEWLSLTLDAYLKNQQSEKPDPSDEHALQCATDYITCHYPEQITLKTLGKLACMSQTKLKRQFRMHYGMSITEYIQKTRILFATELLQHSDRDIKAIAEQVGYRSHSRFTTLFKRFTGRYPKELRSR